MKRLKYKLIIPCGLVLLVMAYACNKDFLNKPPLGTLSPSIVANKAGVEGLLIGAYSLLDGNGGNGGGWGAAGSNWVYGSVCADDAYKGSTPSDQGDIAPLELWNADATNGYPSGKWALCYDAIQRCNDVLRTLPLATDISAADALQMTAEARFLRGHYHFELKRVFGNVAFVGEDITVGNNNYNVPNIDASGNYVNIWPQIEQDLQFAADNLPETLPQAGRVNKWAATAMLAKVNMAQLNYSAALPLLNSLIASGKCTNGINYKLNLYQDNFNPATQRSGGLGETVFAVQNSVNDGSANDANGNGNYGDVLNFPYGDNPAGVCCGFFNPSQDLANAYKTDAAGLPLLDTWFVGNSVSGTPAYAGNLDSRVDWVIGRPGIPYLDWGNQQTSWVRDPVNDGVFSPKKTSYALSQKGTFSSGESTYWASVQLTANNTNLIRYADVLLWAAECEAAIGSLTNAADLVNQVRARAAKPEGWVYAGGAVYNGSTGQYAPQTTAAATYKVGLYASPFADKPTAIKAIVMERRLEFAMEGQRFFDLQRWDIGAGGAPGSMAAVLNAYAGREKNVIPAYIGAAFKPGINELFLIPQTQIDVVNSAGTVLLKQNPH